MMSHTIESLLRALEPHMHYVNFRDHGYMLLKVRKSHVTSEYWYPTSVKERTSQERLGALIKTDKGSNRVTHLEVF
jgi:hypothetical protein